MSYVTKELYEFGGFRLNVSERLLLDSNGEKVPLTEKVFATLCLLVQKSGSLVRKEDLLEAVWDGAFVEENNLDKAVSALRRALGEKRREKVFIETVRKHGYRFVAEVVRVEIKETAAPENLPPDNLPFAAAKISDNHHYAVKRRGNVLAVADWQPERKPEISENLSAATDDKTALRVVPPAAPVKVRRGWSLNHTAGLLIVLALLGGILAFSFNRVSDSATFNSLGSFERIKFRKVVGSDGGHSPTISPDGKTLITTQVKTNSHLWQMPFADSTRARQLTSGQTYRDGNVGLALAPDGGRIIYASNESGNYEIWEANADGERRRQLTFGGESATEPIVTPDNRYIVFLSETNGVRHLWRMDADGSNPAQLTVGAVEVYQPAVTPDSRFVIYSAYNSIPKGALYRISIDGGEATELTDKFGGGSPVISPDGKWIAYSFYDYETREQPWRAAIIPAAGGAAVKNIEMPLRGLMRWTTDSQSLLHLDKKWMNLWQMPIFGNGAPKQITDFKTGVLRRFTLSPDGKQLFLARGDTETNIVLIQNAP